MPYKNYRDNLILKFAKTISLIFLTLLVLTACTSPLVIGQLYDRVPKKTQKSLERYADFDKNQTLAIRSSLQRYHRWHRETQLTEYSAFMRSAANLLDSGATIDEKTVAGWINSVENFSATLRQCNPINDSADLLEHLSDSQVKQIAEQLQKEKDDELKEYQEETELERRTRRYKTVTKWARRINLPFNPEQAALLQEALKQQKSLGRQRIELWKNWSGQFTALLENRNAPSFKNDVNHHIDRLWTLTKDNYPEEWQETRSHWTKFLHRYLKLQSKKQNEALVLKLNTFAKTSDKLSGKKTSGADARCFRRSL